MSWYAWYLHYFLLSPEVMVRVMGFLYVPDSLGFIIIAIALPFSSWVI
jgi:hypothetical protein